MIRFSVLLVFAASLTAVSSMLYAAQSDKSLQSRFISLSKKSQELKLNVIDLNRSAARYVAKSKSPSAYVYQARNRAEYTFDQVLDDYEQKSYLEAINRYHVGRDLGVIISKYDYALRVANIYLDYGLYDYSKRLFDALLGNEDSSVSSTARYYLARYNYLIKNYDAALSGFESVVDGLPADLLEQNKLYQGILYQKKKNHKKAIEVLSNIEPGSKHYVYGQFNIAISNLRQGWWSDAENAIKNMIDSMNNPGFQDSGVQNRDLMDRLYVALGYSQLQRRYFREAFQSLEKVGKKGAYAYKALLGMGLIAAEQERYRESLEIMNKLVESYSGLIVTEEAHLVIPFLLESVGEQSRTLTYYRRAAKYYANAIRGIDILKKQVSKGKYDLEFVIPHRNANVSIYNEKPRPGEINRYLFELLEEGQWKRAAQELADSREMEKLLKKWQETLSVVGAYDSRQHRKLKDKITRYSQQADKLGKQYLQFLRAKIIEHLKIREDYFHSYMSQSKFALARYYDAALGTEVKVVVDGVEINELLVRNTYKEYLKSASVKSVNRRLALLRIAELELDLRDKLLAEEKPGSDKEKHAARLLERSIGYLNTALDDYPNHEENDRLLYQLIKAYDQKKDEQNALLVMRKLVDNYSHSPFFAEIQFKLGEEYLTGNETIDAELAYSAALRRGNDGSEFYRRALYKRGWSRLRQSYFDDALEDFFQVIELAGYAGKRNLSNAEQTIFEDIMRGITLCFINQDGLVTLDSYYARNHNAPYSDLVYEAMGNTYLQQKRLQDAVDVFQSYIERYSTEPKAPEFLTKIINTWKDNGFRNQEIAARKLLEEKYGLDSVFWKKNDIKRYVSIKDAIKANIEFMASMYHSRYQKGKSAQDLADASHWYERYVKFFKDDSQAHKIHFLYAELLSDARQLDKALEHYNAASSIKEKSAKNAEAAYARIITADALIKKNQADKSEWINKKIEYSLAFAENYPNDKRVSLTLLNALEELFARKQYDKVMENLKYFPKTAPPLMRVKSELLKGHSLFASNQFDQAERIYSTLLKAGGLKKDQKGKVKNQLASAIYKLGESAEKNGRVEQAINHYLRIKQVAPESSVTPIAQYDAATLLIKQDAVDKAMPILEEFTEKYPDHRLYGGAIKKLAVLYMKNNDSSKSAAVFESIAQDKNNSDEERRDALWNAAELYEKQDNTDKALAMYSQYIKQYPNLYSEVMEARMKLVDMYGRKNDSKSQNYWRAQILDAERKNKSRSTDRTKFLAANAALGMAAVDMQYFNSIKLTPPLKQSLLKKKNAMQRAIDSLASAARYSIEETSTQATYQIAQVYQSFSKALLNSPRPGDLKGLELEQYNVLLEEQAFPFEEKAIEFHKANVEMVKNGVYNEWINFSFSQLSKLLPSVYDKPDRLEAFIDPEHAKTSSLPN